MTKHLIDLTVAATERLNATHVLLRLTDTARPLPNMQPGQFVEIRVDHSATTLLRRPISINYVDREHNELWLLVHEIGDGTRALGRLVAGDIVNCLLPLGNGFTLPKMAGRRYLLVGGGVGTAPLLYYGEELHRKGCTPIFLLGARTKGDLLQLDDFRRIGRVETTTEDGSMGTKGFVTQHPMLERERFDAIATCGPKPMMIAVARYADAAGIPCEASLENRMACGLGACLCCVEDTTEGNLCVCKEGPVFNIKRLKWLNSK